MIWFTNILKIVGAALVVLITIDLVTQFAEQDAGTIGIYTAVVGNIAAIALLCSVKIPNRSKTNDA